MKKVLFTLCLLLTFLFIGCNKEKKDSQKTETTFVMGTGNFNGDFYNGWTNSNSRNDNNIRQLIWGGGLLAPTDKGELVLNSFVENKKLSKSDSSKEVYDIWTFKIKDNMKFSNGDPLTVKDIKFTYDFYMNEKALRETGGSSSLNQYIDNITIDEKENIITFKLKQVLYTVDYSVFSTYILDSTLIKAKAKESNSTVQQYVKANIDKPIGYGPYKIEEYLPSNYVKLSINQNYEGNFNGDKPSINNLIVKYVPEETKVTQLLSGEIDGLTTLIIEENIEAVKQDDKLLTNNYFRHGGGALTFHTDFGPVQLPEVRKAFAYEFNRIKFRNLFLGKYGIASNAPYSRNMWMMYDKDEKIGTESRFEKSLISYELLDDNGNYDEAKNIEAAKNLLDQAAFKTEGVYSNLTKSNGKYLWKGEELTLNLALTSSLQDAVLLTLTDDVQEKFGMKINIDSMDWAVESVNLYGTAPLSERRYHMFISGVSYSLKYDPYEDWSKTKIIPYGRGASNNSSRYVGNEDLLNDIRFSNPSTDEGTLNYKKSWRKWIVETNDKLPVLPLYSNNYFDAYTNKLSDYDTNALWQWPYAIVKAKLK